MSSSPERPGKSAFWFGGGLLGFIVLGVVSSNSSTGPRQNAVATAPVESLPDTVEAPAYTDVPAVQTASAALAAKHLTLALDSEGFAGAMTYSQSCFRSLEVSFSWRKLDQCGAFDALTTLAISQSDGFQPEATYFNSAASAERFTQWADKERVDPQMAQAHLDELDQAALANIPRLQQSSDDVGNAAAPAGETVADEADANTGDSLFNIAGHAELNDLAVNQE